jgi:SAM-dependent methyltransferase
MLDVGCGIGTPAFRLADATPAEIRGISINKAQVDEANRRAAERGLADRVSFDHGDALALPYPDGSYDAAWAFESLIHMDRPAALREIRRVLKPGARLVVADLLLVGELTGEDQVAVRDGLARMSASPMLTELEYRALVAEAGFELVELLDVSDHTRKTPRRMVEAVHARRDEMVQRFGPEANALMDLMLSPSALLPQLGYLVATLRRPA